MKQWKHLPIILAFFNSGCGNTGNANSKDNLTRSPELPDPSRFEYLNKKLFDIRKSDARFGSQNPDTLTRSQRKKWDFDEGFGLKLSNIYYGAKFYSLQPSVGEIQPIVLDASSDDYSAYVLLCLDKNANLISWLDLSGGIEGGPDSISKSANKNEIADVYSHHKYSEFLNDSVFETFLLKSVNVIDTISKKEKNLVFDSIAFTRKIERNGKLTVLKHDSVRLRDPLRE